MDALNFTLYVIWFRCGCESVTTGQRSFNSFLFLYISVVIFFLLPMYSETVFLSFLIPFYCKFSPYQMLTAIENKYEFQAFVLDFGSFRDVNLQTEQ